MRIDKYLLLTIICYLTQNCTEQNNHNKNKLVAKYYVTVKDSAIIERRLLHTKNVIFTELYRKSVEETYAKKNIVLCDSLDDVSFEYFGNYDITTIFDSNKKKMLRQWLDKSVYFISKPYAPEYPDGSMDLARALDFYNSTDLEFYIDSLRGSYYKNIMEIEYNNRIPENAVVPYIPKRK